MGTMIKKTISLGIILTLICTLTIPALAAEKIKDVPKDHWAYKSVKKLVEKGFMSLHEDSTFKGEEKVTRYQLAEVIAEVLVGVNQGKVQASQEDMDTLRKLSTEFRSELVELNKRTDVFSKKVENLEEKVQVANEDIVSTKGDLKKIRKRVNKIIEDIKNTKSSINARLSRVESKNRNLEERITTLEDRLSQTKNKNEELKSKLNDQLMIGGGLLLLLLMAN